ncbi:hypothetical protein DL767_004082 [Monosporascus sp. MG133]|nr:hypothetical protein DL767_004082 [Monosporascus sp. MG133]
MNLAPGKAHLLIYDPDLPDNLGLKEPVHDIRYDSHGIMTILPPNPAQRPARPSSQYQELPIPSFHFTARPSIFKMRGHAQQHEDDESTADCACLPIASLGSRIGTLFGAARHDNPQY